MDEEIIIVRAYMMQGDFGHRDRLADEVMGLLRAQGIPGATEFRGVAGFGAHGAAESDLLHLATNMPLIVEFFAAPGPAQAAMAALRAHRSNLRIVFWHATQWR
jgi:PII-like signaling protein